MATYELFGGPQDGFKVEVEDEGRQPFEEIEFEGACYTMVVLPMASDVLYAHEDVNLDALYDLDE